MAELDISDVLEGLSVVHVQRVPLAAAVQFLAVGMNQRNRLTIRQRSLRLSLFRLVVNLPEVIPHEECLMQVRSGADSFDRVPVLDEGLELDNLQLRVLLLEVDNPKRQSIGVGYRVFNYYREREHVIL